MIADVQIVKQDGVPVAAVLPWAEFRRLAALDEPKTAGIPQAVVELVLAGNSPVKAWRKHLGLTQEAAAGKIGITQGAYAQIEKAKYNQAGTLRKIAAAFGIEFDQIDMV